MLDGFLRQNDLCFALMNEIAPRIRLEDFEDMYKEGGRPPISPKVLLLVLIMQFIERLSDRAASYNLRYRIDWKIALGVELSFEGIHPTTLVKFRDRLLTNEEASYAFDKIIEYLVEQGLIKRGSKQRIDSTHIVGKVRELSRLELFHENLRLFCSDINELIDEMPQVICDLYEYYADEISIRGISEPQKKKYLREAGAAMKAFIDWSSHDEVELVALKSFKIMKKVFEQNFKDDPDPDGPELIKVATGKGHICSPHESEARFASKGAKDWLGYKAQIAETITEGQNEVNFIVHAELGDATDYDGDAIDCYIEEQKQNDLTPSEVYADTHYNTADNIQKLSDEDVALKGPVAPQTKKANAENTGFNVDHSAKKVICPEDKKSEKFSVIKDNRIKARFSQTDCQECSRKTECKAHPRGKQIQVRIENRLLSSRRRLIETEDFRIDMHQRNGIEGTISGLIRGTGMRISRYRGKSKTRLQIKFSAAAANITRLHRQRQLSLRSLQLLAG